MFQNWGILGIAFCLKQTVFRPELYIHSCFWPRSPISGNARHFCWPVIIYRLWRLWCVARGQIYVFFVWHTSPFRRGWFGPRKEQAANKGSSFIGPGQHPYESSLSFQADVDRIAGFVGDWGHSNGFEYGSPRSSSLPCFKVGGA